MTVIGLVGRQGSGKSEVARVLKAQGYGVVSMGDAVRAEARSRGLEPTSEVMGSLSNELREEGGRGAVADLLLDNQDVEGDVVIDGLRSDAEAEVFREELDSFFLVAVTAPQRERYDRVFGRGRSDDVESFEEFQEKEEREDSWGLQAAIDDADHTVENTGTLEELREESARLPLYSCRVIVEAPVEPTETFERVERAASTLFPEIELYEEGEEVRGEGFVSDLEHFRDRVFEQRIIDTARAEFQEGRLGEETRVELDKGSAWTDRVNFDVGGYLGPISLRVRGRVDDFVEWVAPPTEEGEPLVDR